MHAYVRMYIYCPQYKSQPREGVEYKFSLEHRAEFYIVESYSNRG